MTMSITREDTHQLLNDMLDSRRYEIEVLEIQLAGVEETDVTLRGILRRMQELTGHERDFIQKSIEDLNG